MHTYAIKGKHTFGLSHTEREDCNPYTCKDCGDYVNLTMNGDNRCDFNRNTSEYANQSHTTKSE